MNSIKRSQNLQQPLTNSTKLLEGTHLTFPHKANFVLIPKKASNKATDQNPARRGQKSIKNASNL